MRAKEMIVEELKEVQKHFENMSGGSCPLCILEAIERKWGTRIIHYNTKSGKYSSYLNGIVKVPINGV